MGLDLILMPLNRTELKGIVVGYERLEFVRDYQIFAQISDVKGKSVLPDAGIECVVRTHPLPPKINIIVYGENGIKLTRKNPCDEEMVYATAREMRKITLPKRVSPVNKAIMEYIKALPRDTAFVLEWS